MIDYEGLRFRTAGAGPDGTIACYHHDGDLVWAESDFFSLGGDSLANAELLTAVEQEFSVLLDVEALLHQPTPAGIAGYVLAQEGKER